jgi:PPOX class probable F420-dependent enzyme
VAAETPASRDPRFAPYPAGYIERMATIQDSDVRQLLEKPNYAVVSTHNPDDSIHSTVVWVDTENSSVAVNSAIGRKWPTNLQRDPRVNVLVQEADNPYYYVEIRGQARATTDGADEHINRLAKKYIGQDEYPYRQPGEQRVKFVIEPERVRLVRQ